MATKNHRRARAPRISGEPDVLSVTACALAEVLELQEKTLAGDPRNLRPGELVRLVNSTPMGTVLTARALAGHRSAAGLRIGDKRIDFLKYAGWLAERRHLAKTVQPAAATMAPPRMVKTLREVATEFGVAYDTVKGWKRNGMPGDPGALDLVAIARWLRERDGNTAAGDTATPSLAELEKRTRIRVLSAEASKREREEAQELGNVVSRADVENEIAKLLSELGKTLDRVPERLKSLLPADIQHTVAAELRRILQAARHEVADRMQSVQGKESQDGESNA